MMGVIRSIFFQERQSLIVTVFRSGTGEHKGLEPESRRFVEQVHRGLLVHFHSGFGVLYRIWHTDDGCEVKTRFEVVIPGF